MSRMQMGSLALAGLILAGCAARDVYEPIGNGEAVDRMLADAAFTEETDCLSPVQYDSVEVLSNDRLLFQGTTNQVWINDLKTNCPGLTNYDALEFEKRGPNLCEFDNVRGLDRQLISWQEGPLCTLGQFRKLDEGVAEDVMAALGAR